MQAVGFDGTLGGGGVVGAEDEDGFAVHEDGVEVGDADAFVGEDFDGVGGAAGFVVEFDGEDLGDGDGHSGRFQDLERAGAVVADKAADAVLGRVGYGEGYQLNTTFLQELEHSYQGAGRVLNENG